MLSFSRLHFAFLLIMLFLVVFNMDWVTAQKGDARAHQELLINNGLMGWTADFVGNHQHEYKPILEWKNYAHDSMSSQLHFNANFLQGSSFLYMAKEFSSLKPGVQYQIFADMTFATNAALNCKEGNGSAGRDVSMKVGTSDQFPITEISELPTGSEQKFVEKRFLNFDLGPSESYPGQNTIVVGPVGYYDYGDQEYCNGKQFVEAELNAGSMNPLFVTANPRGKAVVVIGFESSSFVGDMDIYFKQIKVRFEPVNGPAGESFPLGLFRSL